MRLALGASRGRLISQLLIEEPHARLSGRSGRALVGEVGQTVLRKLFLDKGTTIGVLDDPRTMLFACLAALLAGLLTGIAPALQSGRDDLVTALKSGVREGTPQRSRTRSALLLAQGALSVFLLVGAGLFVRSLRNVASIPLGYDVDPLLYVSTDMRGVHLDKEQDIALKARLEQEARAIPGVERATQVLTIPLWQMRTEDFSVPGIDSASHLGHVLHADGQRRLLPHHGHADHPRPRLRLDGSARVAAQHRRFRRHGAEALAARECAWEMREGGRRHDALLRRSSAWPRTSRRAISSRMTRCNTISRSSSSARRVPRCSSACAAARRTSRDSAKALAAIDARCLVRDRHADATTSSIRARGSWRMGAAMFLLFGLLALILAAIGLYSVIAYNVAQRTHELGLRIALGAHARDVLRMVLGEGLRFGLAGIGIGVIIALGAGHWVQPLLYEESAHDPLVFVAVATVLAIVAIAASAIPASRAICVDPSIALRTE